MIPELKALEPRLKQILYNCVEHVKATKAALYLSSSADLSAKTFEIVTSYQYNVGDRKIITSNDDLVDRLAVKRNAFFVNGLAADQRFAEMQFRQGTDRILATPIFSRGRLVGFIDMRDKAGKKPFENADLEAARRIADEMATLLSEQQLFGLSPITLVEHTPIPNVSSKTPRPNTLAVPLNAGEVFSPAAAQAIEAARAFMGRRQHAPAARRHILTETDFEVIRLLLPAALAIPGAVMASFTAVGHLNNPQSIVAIAHVLDDSIEMLREHLRTWLERNHQKLPASWPEPALIYPFGVQVVPVTAAGISTMLSAPVNPQSIDGLIITVAFETTPEAQAQRALDIFLRQIDHSVDTAIGATSGHGDRQLIAEKLLEPDFLRVPDLAIHCREVATVSQRFAQVLERPWHEVETIRIGALVHDVGMRLLDYERLYRRPSLTAEELRGLAEHTVVGAAIVEPLLGPEIAAAVLRHHERVDGKGYPSHLAGDQIPLSARIIAIADAWVSMTSSRSYASPVGEKEAISRLRANAGTQFDAPLVAKFIASIDQIIDRS